MDNCKFKLWNRICAAAVFVISAVVYLCTIEPTASFWDCGEFIASSYKLEVGHPPGNPVFQLIARIFTMFGDSMHAAVLVNAMSALCSALTIFLLYLTIVWLAKRLIKPAQADGSYSLVQALSIFGSGIVGALAYTFSDTFWFSAVEGEVYAMSSLFTALVFWAMTKWYDTADEPHSAKWIVLIAFLMGLSIGVHLLNLLAIPALVFIFYYRRNEGREFKFLDLLKIFAVGVIILAIILFVIIPYLPKMAAYTDLFFVNTLGLKYNTGAVFFLIAVLALCFWGIWVTMQKGKLFWNTTLLCLTSIIVGFSVFSMDVIRSAAKTPTNEYQPDNAFTLVRYLSREQYGRTPLLYGQYFDSPYTLESTSYWAPLPDKDGKDHYYHVSGPVEAKYKDSGKMLFPRMWSPSADGRNEEFYQNYTRGKGTRVPGAQYKKPTMGANLAYFFDYQMNWMYWRYFMWNFVGRQNEIHSPTPGNIFHGNWESGIGFLDELRLGDQSSAPSILSENKGKNHFFFLPLILGVIGLCYQFAKDKRGSWLTFLMFFMTGIAIVIYLNQPPFQVRERDYAYAGSFYFFSAWIGLGVAGIVGKLSDYLKDRKLAIATGGAVVLCLFVPAIMGAQGWDDHDRSGRRTAVEMAYNYLNSVGQDGILITHGDNDTFPLWYAQEVENVRTDVRICNTSLLGTDWHIDQMRYAVNESAPLPIQIPHTQYLYGVNEYVPIIDKGDMTLGQAVAIFRDPKQVVPLSSGRKVDYFPSRKVSIPINFANAVGCGLMTPAQAEEYRRKGIDQIVLSIPKDKDYLSKPELFMLDLLSNYDWSRPLHVLNQGGDLNMGIKDYLEYCGFSYRFTPIKNKISGVDVGQVNTDELYRKMTQVFKWDALSAPDYFIDNQNCYTFMGVMSIRQLFLSCATSFYLNHEDDRALQMLDKCMEVMNRYPMDTIPIGFPSNDYMCMGIMRMYYNLGQADKGLAIARELGLALLEDVAFYYDYYEWAKNDFETSLQYLYFLEEELRKVGETDLADRLSGACNIILGTEDKEENS